MTTRLHRQAREISDAQPFQSITGPVLGSCKGTYTGYDINVAPGSPATSSRPTFARG